MFSLYCHKNILIILNKTLINILKNFELDIYFIETLL